MAVKAGKGDDVVNEVIYDDDSEQFGIKRLYDMVDGELVYLKDGHTFTASYGETFNDAEVIYGEQGDDQIWGGAYGTTLNVSGGSGDDYIVSGH